MHIFYIKNAISLNLCVGDSVQFELQESDLDIKIFNIKKNEDFIQDHWNSNVPTSNVTGTVTKIVGRMVYVTAEDGGNIKFNLNSVSAEFIPVEGDILTSEGDSQGLQNVTTNDINHTFTVKNIRPKAAIIKYGMISGRNDNYGTINNFAVFSEECCEPGFVPEIGDQVLASLIRIDNRKDFQWRAIQVVQRSQNVAYEEKFSSKNHLHENTHWIIIPVEVENTNYHEVELLSVHSKTFDSCNDWRQVSLMNPKNTQIVLKPNMKLSFIFKIEAKFIGYSSEEYTWKFSEFSVTRLVELDVTNQKCTGLVSEQSIERSHNYQTNLTALKLLNQAAGNIMPGQKKYLSCRMYPVQLGEFPLPKQILKAALPISKMQFNDVLLEVVKALPCLKEELSPRTYLARFSGLLFLEEVEHLKQIAELSIEKVNFRKAGEYLIIKVPQFSSYRLISGDKAIATKPWDNGNFKYEGIIHKIKQSEIWLKFSTSFHESYSEGTQFSVSFSTSRVSLRRMHQALSTARKFLGDAWLFPTGVESSLNAIFQEGLKISMMLQNVNLEPPKIGSVEEFQGQEKMVIIMTVVRSNLQVSSCEAPMSFGFVKDPKRVNVAMSRARAVLIIIGNPHFLYQDRLWRKILKYSMIDNKSYIGCDLPFELL